LGPSVFQLSFKNLRYALKRRQFIKTSAAGSCFAAAPAIVRGQNLNSKLQFAAIGTDGKGFGDAKEMIEHEGVHPVGFCDVDLARTKRILDHAPDTPVFQDYREMLDKLGDKVDAVTVSTPDHMHAYITLDAMRRGLNVYCQKPLTHNLWEARQVAKEAAKGKGKLITRLGNQIHSHEFYRTAVRAVQSGAIGKVKRIYSWVDAPGHGRSGHIDRPKNLPAVPNTLNWDLWLGVAPERPYGGNRVYHPWGWRDWQDFGNGALGDFGCHILDPVFTALNLTKAPLKVTCAEHSGMNDEVWPCQCQVDYVLPGSELTTADQIELTWSNGGVLPVTSGPKLPLHRSGSLLYGEKGVLHIPHVDRPRFHPEEKFPAEKIEVVAGSNHYHGWIDGCLSGEQPSDGFEYGALLTETALLGKIAQRFRGETLEWDSEKLRITNHQEANRWVSRDYREGWKIETAG
jgi:predicted dehydrogenase